MILDMIAIPLYNGFILTSESGNTEAKRNNPNTRKVVEKKINLFANRTIE